MEQSAKSFLSCPVRGPRRRRFLIVLVCALGFWAFLRIAETVTEEGMARFDKSVLLSLRVEGDTADPVGPPWVEEMARDITALGSMVILFLLVGSLSAFLWLSGRKRAFVFVLSSCLLGVLFSSVLKEFYDRARPDVVAHGMHTLTKSFPSGHAMLSAVIYLTTGVLIARAIQGARLKAFVILVAIGIAVLVGLSRLYLGVHWPTDVMGGWLLGTVWALSWWLVAETYLPKPSYRLARTDVTENANHE